ncbi:hypothetical protein NQ176_g4567 [Zarea fungicola]|uniref:Uncharacterized protein n=1 Tax=Zarea fungicola TaxID=93591 RepID=A0ACC1NCS5_9HYPO|nr:hypothetical protein NQ176_g4567 [Lecanicillium fungicola]
MPQQRISQGQPPDYETPSQSEEKIIPPGIFGIDLEDLEKRDRIALPMIVLQCINAVNLYGLGGEGLYRLSGSYNHINRLKSTFDASWKTPDNFYHDINNVTGLLKQFLLQLPNPLMRAQNYFVLMHAAKKVDENIRRDTLHAIINTLPEPHYAILRALAFHFARVTLHDEAKDGKKKLDATGLAIILAPTLIGPCPDPQTTKDIVQPSAELMDPRTDPNAPAKPPNATAGSQHPPPEPIASSSESKDPSTSEDPNSAPKASKPGEEYSEMGWQIVAIRTILEKTFEIFETDV